MTNSFGRYIFVVLFLLGVNVAVFGQDGRLRIQRRDPYFGRPRYYRPAPPVVDFQKLPPLKRMQIKKEEYISKQLMLSPDQTNRFLALYRQYQQEVANIRWLKRLNNSAQQPNGTEQLNKELAFEHQLTDLKDHYAAEFLKIMPPEKVSVIFKSEREFNDEAFRILRERSPATVTTEPPPN